ncbi:MAG: NirD/YgiW/YdeI family stress tolerance protein [Desulfovibrio sp.]
MRYLLVMLMSLMLAAPAFAANTADAPAAPHAARKAKGVTKVAPVDTVAKALAAANKTPVSVTGTIVEPVQGKKNRYVFEDGTGRMTVALGKKAAAAHIEAQSRVHLAGVMVVKSGKESVMAVRKVEMQQ